MRLTRNWKFIAGTASFAVIVSIFASAIRGVSFGAVLVRAFVGGISFAVLAFVLIAVVDRFFPDMLRSMSKSATGDAQEPGASIDITIDEENPHDDVAEIEAVRELQNAPGDGADAAESDNQEQFAAMSEDVNSGDDGAMDAPLFAVEVQEVSADGGESAEEVEEIEPIEEIDGIDSGGDVAIEESADTGRFDGLDTFDGGIESPMVSNRRKVDLMGAEEEPEVIAKAVRTLMKRDQEG